MEIEPEQQGGAPWLPETFAHPLRVDWAEGVHLRPISPADIDIDMPAVMGNRDMLWSRYGDAWGWPPASMTREEDIEDLQRHADEMVRHESFNYAILPADESELYGCLYIDPLDGREGCEAEVSWWVTATAPGWLREKMDGFAVTWVTTTWPFTRIVTPFN